MKKLGDIFLSRNQEYMLVDLSILYPDGFLGKKIDNKEKYCLLKVGAILNTFNGGFASIEDLEKCTNEAINSIHGKRFNYRWGDKI